jgi:2-polyprenyl-6-methoxyphenol hydroxylase-like FAD-dependent oxidoreductase
MTDTEVLIVGAGPTGLVLALWLKRLHVPFRIVDRAEGPGEQSRAMAVHARTLELYAQLGLAEGAIERGIVTPRLGIWRDRRRVSEVVLRPAGEGTTPYPYVLILAQDDHERFLLDRLKAEGVEVEWSTELTDLVETADGWRAALQKGKAGEAVAARFVCGCDGAHSAVRHHLGIEFRGGTYKEVFFVADADVIGSAADRALNLCLDADGVCIVAPVRRTGAHRVIGLTPADKQEKSDLSFKDVQPLVRRVTGLTVSKVNWFSIYRVHHRAAVRFGQGTAFLLGDAAHIHSPVGGQGMNTGIGDASNLAWKIADVVHGRADRRLLDTYETERHGFAKRLLATTDLMFRRVADRSGMGRMWRSQLLPTLLPLVAGAPPTRRTAFRTLSQIGIEYHASALSAGGAGKVRGGDRLPWLELEDGDNFAPLNACAWRIQVYGRVKAKLEALTGEMGLPIDRFRFDKDAQKAGFMKDALYLVRPDGYVAFAEPTQSADALRRFLRRNGLTFSADVGRIPAAEPAQPARRKRAEAQDVSTGEDPGVGLKG